MSTLTKEDKDILSEDSDFDKYSEDSVDCEDGPPNAQKKQEMAKKEEEEKADEKKKLQARIDKYTKEKLLDKLGNIQDPEKTYDKKGNEIDKEGNILKITSPRTAQRNKMHSETMRKKMMESVPVSKKLVRKKFKDIKKNVIQYDRLENLTNPIQKINHINSMLENIHKNKPELIRTDLESEGSILIDKQCLPSTMGLMDKYYKENGENADSKMTEHMLQLMEYASRLNNYMKMNTINLFSESIEKANPGEESKETKQILTFEDIQDAEAVIQRILKKYDGMAEDAITKVQMEIDRFVFDHTYQKQVLLKTWKTKLDIIGFDKNKDGVLQKEEFLKFMKEKDDKFKQQFNSYPLLEDEYKDLYQAIINMQTRKNGVSPLGFTKYKILFQMVNEKYKETKASKEKDARKKVWMKLRNWVQTDVKYANFVVEPYMLQDHDFQNEIWGKTLQKVEKELKVFIETNAKFMRALFDIDDGDCISEERDQLVLCAFNKMYRAQFGNDSPDGSANLNGPQLFTNLKNTLEKLNEDEVYKQLILKRSLNQKKFNDYEEGISLQEFKIIFWPVQDFYAQIPPNVKENQECFILCNFEENRNTGQKFLRIAMKNLIEDKDDEKLGSPDKKNEEQSDDDENKQYIEVHAYKFYQMNQITQEFELQFETLYDVTDGQLDYESVGFTNDNMLCNDRHTFFWKKERNVPKLEGYYTECTPLTNDYKPATNDYVFQLYKHEMRKPTSLLGIQDLREVSKYKCFDSWKDALPVPGYAINCEKIIQTQYVEEKQKEDQVAVPIENLSIVFLQNAETQNDMSITPDDEFLDRQFVAVTVKCLSSEGSFSTSVSIYYLKDLVNPIISVKAKSIQKFQKGFFLREQEDDEGKITFLLMGLSTDFRISYEFKEQPTGAIGFFEEEDPSIFKQERFRGFQKFTHHMCKVQQEIDLLMPYTAETITVNYFRSEEGPLAINPLRTSKPENLPLNLQSRQHELEHILKGKFNKFNEQGGTKMYDDKNFSCECVDEIKDNILFHIDKNRDIVDEEFFAYKDIIVMCSWSSPKIHYWICKDNFERLNFKEKIKEAIDNTNYIQEKILEQFSIQNQVIQHDNYHKYMKPQEDIREKPNHYINPLYMHANFKEVVLSHSMIHIQKERLMVDEDFVFMDLGEDKDTQDKSYFPGKLSMIRLFAKEPEVSYNFGASFGVVKGCKLVKYHISHKQKKALLFFHQRNNSKDMGGKMSGIYFYCIVNIADLRKLSKDNILKDVSKYLMQGDIKCIVMKSMEIYEGYQYQNGKQMLYQQVETVKNTISDVILHFDPVIDLRVPENSPQDSFYSFIYVGPNKSESREFYNYLCIIDLTLLNPSDIDERFKKRKNKFQFDPRNFCKYFQLEQFFNFYEKGENSQFKLDVGTQEFKQQGTQFTRCSNWQKNLFPNEPGNDKISTRFQFGIINNNYQGKHVEIRDFILTFQNDDELKVEDKFVVDHVGLKYALPSSDFFVHYSEKFVENCFQKYLIPKVDDNGNFTGSSMMVQTACYYYKPVKLMDQVAIRCNDEDPFYDKDAEYLNKGRGKALEGQWGIVIFKSDQETKLLTMDGTEIDAKEQEIWQFNEFKSDLREITRNMPNRSQIYQWAHLVRHYPLMYQYEAIDLNNDLKDDQAQLETALMQVGTKKYIINNRPGTNMQIVSSKFLKDVILQRPFDYSMQLAELHISQQQLMVMSYVNFMEAYRLKKTHAIQSYFQPKWILNGLSLCGNDYPEFSSSINTLKKSLALTEEESPQYLTAMNGPIETQYEAKNNLLFDETAGMVDFYFKMMGVNKFNSFLYNLNQVSLIQKGLDEGLTKPVREIYNAIINTLNNPKYQEVMMQDLPQFLYSDKIKIHDFLNTEDKEDANDGNDKLLDCNIEILLQNSDLPFQGPDSMMFRNFDKFSNIYKAVNEIEEKIIADDRKYKKEQKDKESTKKKEQWEIDKEEQQKKEQEDLRIRLGRPPEKEEEFKNEWKSLKSGDADLSGSSIVEHFIINFMPTIRKIKIDLMINRINQAKECPDHLKDLKAQKKTAKDFLQIDDVLLADYFMQQQDNKVFYEQTSVIKLIDKQFKETRVLYLRLLTAFFGLYFIPLCLGLFTTEPIFKIILFIVGSLTQLFYFRLEICEIQQKGLSQFREYIVGWNVNDFSMPFIYMLHIFLYYFYEQMVPEKIGLNLVYNIVSIVCLGQSVIKIMQYVRVIDNFGFLVQMMTSVFLDLIPFFAIFFIFVLFFGLVIQVMGADFENQREVYPGIPKFIVILIQIFRNSIGDITVINYGVWIPEEGVEYTPHEETQRSLAIGILWIFWFFNEFLMLIIILNFLIAEVSQTYDRVKGAGNQFLYKKKCEVNQTAFTYRKELFKKDDKFAIIAFKCPKDAAAASGNDEFFGFTNTIAKDAKKMLAMMKVDLNKYTMKIHDRIKQNKKGADFTAAQIDNALKKVTKAQEVFKDSFDQMHKDLEETARRYSHTKGWTREQLKYRREKKAAEEDL